VVLDARDGALAKLLPPFKLGGGGPVGSGQQYWSWVSLEDVLGLIHFSLFTPAVQGPVNAVAPGSTRQAELARTLGKVLSRPAFLPMPAAALKAAMGEMGQSLLLFSSHVKPEAALRHGYTFLHPNLEGALRFTLGHTTEGVAFHRQ
jgi:hypothetical protein